MLQDIGARRLRVSRWAQLALCAIAAASVVFVAYRSILHPLNEALRPLGLAAPIALFLVFLALGLRGGWNRFLQGLGLRHPIAYPPSWVAAAVGTCLLVLSAGIRPEIGHQLDLDGLSLGEAARYSLYLALACAFAGAVVAWAARHPRHEMKEAPRARSGRASVEVTASVGVLATDQTQLLAWLKDDREIDDPALDAFGHSIVARRIADRLANPHATITESRTSALVGRRGSGKSSIQQLVRHELARQGRARQEFVSLSLWPYESPEAAVRAVLERLVSAASRHVDSTSLRGVPADYLDLIETAGGGPHMFMNALRRPRTPETILRSISDALLAVDVDIIIWLDDLDRFGHASTRGSSPGDARLSEYQGGDRLARIRSLIYLLDRTPRVEVVLASTSIEDGFDLDKIARFIEQPPSVSPNSAWPIIRNFREHCLAGRDTEYLDFAGRGAGHGLEPPASADVTATWLLALSPNSPIPQMALADLLRTPRLLKDALRDCLDRWGRLRGEVDFDDLLAISAIRAARESDVYAYLLEHAFALRELPRSDKEIGQKRSEWITALHKRLDDIILQSGEPREGAALRSLVSFVFPAWGEGSHQMNDGPKPQALKLETYWTRYVSGHVSAASPADQPVLRAIEAWRSGGKNDLVERMLDPSQIETVEHFGFRFSREELCRLLVETTDALALMSVSRWGDRHPPALVSIARLLIQKPPRPEAVGTALRAAVSTAAQTNLALLAALLYWFVTESGQPQRVASGPPEELKALAAEKLVKFISTADDEALVAALRDGPYWTLQRLTIVIGSGAAGDPNSMPFEGWEVIAKSTLRAAKTHPKEILPQIASCLIDSENRLRKFDVHTDDDPGPIDQVPVFNLARASAWFDLDKLAEAFLEANPDSSLDEIPRLLVTEVRDALAGMQ